MLGFLQNLVGRLRPSSRSTKRSSADFPLVVTSDGVNIGLRVVFDATGNSQIEDRRCAVVANGQTLSLHCASGADLVRSFCPALERYLMQNLRHPTKKSAKVTDRDIYRSLLSEDGVWGLPVKKVSGSRHHPFSWSFVRRGPTNTSYDCSIDLQKRTLTFQVKG